MPLVRYHVAPQARVVPMHQDDKVRLGTATGRRQETTSDQPVADIHDRRPVVLQLDVARQWLEPGLLPEHAEDLARHHDTPVEAFECYPVDKAVGNVKNHGRELIKRMNDPLL